MLKDEFMILCLKTNGHVIGVTKEYIIVSEATYPIPFSTEVLNLVSFGLYVGIRSGIYMHKREGKVNWIKERPHLTAPPKVCSSP
jgi:hypothetical protein